MTEPINAVATQDAIAYDAPSNATNFGARAALWAQGGSDQRRPFIYMARPFPLNSNVTADLELTVDRAAASATRTITVQLVAKSWSESKLTWDNAKQKSDPDASDSLVTGPKASVTVTGALKAGDVIKVPVSALMQLVSAGEPWYGFRIVNSSSSGVYFRSREATSGKPRLTGQYSLAPAAPTRLSPSAGRAVSIARPTLSFDFTNRTGSMTALRVRLFSGAEESITVPVGMSERVGTFNYNGIVRSGVPSWATRVPLIVDTMFNSGAKLIGCQEANSTSAPDEPGTIRAGLNAKAGSSGQWETFIGSNLNVIFNDAAVFEAQWSKTKDTHLGDGKYVCAMLFKHKASGAMFIYWTTHYLTSDELTKQIKHTNVLISVLASLRAQYNVPLIGGGDLNAKQKTATRPIGMLTVAGHIGVRDLVEPEDITNAAYNSLDSYDPNDMLGYWIDHLFVSGGPQPTAVGLLDSGDASDHNLIWADIDYVLEAATVSDLGAPTFDSGEVPAETPLYTLPVDVELDGLVWWQVQVKDESEWSAWSEPTYFIRKAKPGLEIVNPAAAPNNFVSEATPPIIWMTDGTQAAYQVDITEKVSGVEVYGSRRQGGDDQSLTPPSDLPLVVGRVYTVRVRIEDDIEREATAGDPIYVEQVQDFTFELSGTAPPVSGIAAYQVDERPWARIEITMDTAADALEILRDEDSLGVFDPADLAEADTLYVFVDREATPYRKHTWTARAITNGETSSDNPTTAPLELVSEGVWLALPDGSLSVCIWGDNPVEWAPDEDVEFFRPKGATRAHVVTHGVFGRKGALKGNIEAIPGIDYEEQRAAWNALADRRTYPYGTEMLLTKSDSVTRFFWTGVLTGERDEFNDSFDVLADLNEIPR